VLTIVSRFATPARAAISRRLAAVALGRLLVTICGGVLATISGSSTQPCTFIRRGLSTVTLSRSRLTQLRRTLPIHGGMTTVPPALIELRRLWIWLEPRLALGTDRRSVVITAGGVRSSARVFVSFGHISSGRTG
jgi:hypothetical protein